jgi:hypothetical protein
MKSVIKVGDRELLACELVVNNVVVRVWPPLLAAKITARLKAQEQALRHNWTPYEQAWPLPRHKGGET